MTFPSHSPPFVFREDVAELSQELINNCATAFRAGERARKKRGTASLKASFILVCCSKCGGSFAGVLADEADQRRRPTQRRPSCL